MNAETFSSAYEREPGRVDRHLDSEQERLLERPNDWSKTFGYILHDYLSTGVSPVTEGEFKKAMIEYGHWFSADFASLFGQALSQAEESNTPESYSLLNHLNFHTINRVMLPLWSDTLFNEKGVQRSHVREAQTILSSYGIHYMKDREDRIKKGTYFDPQFAEYRGVSSGILNEYDTAIALLDISLKDPDIAILPAPIQFESQQPSSFNSDFIAIRQSNRQARGIQAKARCTEENYFNYDPDYVTLIDGFNDLGNSRTVRTDSRRSRQSLVAWPGLLSAEYLTYVKLDGLKNLNNKVVLQNKFQARQLLGSTKPYAKTANARVSERVLYDLERQAAPLVDTVKLK